MTTNEHAPASEQLAKSADHSDFSKANYTTNATWLRVQQFLAERRRLGMSPHAYDASKPRGALLQATLVYLIKAGNQACRATTIKEVAKKAGFTAGEVRAVLYWLILIGAAYQVATAESTVQLRLTGGEQ